MSHSTAFPRLVLALVAAGLLMAPLTAAAKKLRYPKTPVKEEIHEYGNIRLPDPFVWLEDKNDPDNEEWFRAQDAFARKRIGKMPGRDELFERIKEIDEAKTVKISSFNRRFDRFFYLKQEVGEEVGKLYYRDGIDGEGRLVADAADFAASDIIHSIMGYQPSYDGKLVGVTIGAGGSEIPDLYIIEVESGEVVDGPIPRVRSYPGWLQDGSGFYYTQLRPDSPDQDPGDRYKRQYTKFHKLGTDLGRDELVVWYDTLPLPGMSEVDTAYLFPLPDSPYTMAVISHGVERADSYFVARDFDPAKAGETVWTNICTKEDGIESVDYHDGMLYMLSHKDAPRRKVLSAPIEDFDKSRIVEILPQSDKVLSGINVLGGRLYVTGMEVGIDFLMTKDLGDPGSVFKMVDLPVVGRVTILSNDYRMSDPYLALTSWTRAFAYYRYNPEDGSVEQSDLRPLGPFDAPEGMVTKRYMVPSHDGVEVPLTVVHHESVQLDGTNPARVWGYGAYGISLRPGYGPLRLPWIERGGVFAVAHVRGGGELGKAWHDGGHLETKRNSWLDLNACAEFLIEKGYTSRGSIAAQGGSMGGVLVGKAMQADPGLFGAIVSSVGNHNPVRNHRRANGPANYPEYGNPLDPEEFPYVLAMDSYFGVQDGVRYPPVLLTCGYNDTRVDAWMPGKMAARLQQADHEGGPFFLRVEFEAGHGGVARSAIWEEQADIYAFLFWALGK
ncbi:MAG: prolyl oligopeptidase family serine peptidase [Puniceicoccaceae bacterium]